jgi:hypothetical protein
VPKVLLILIIVVSSLPVVGSEVMRPAERHASKTPAAYLFGTLQTDPRHIEDNYRAGLRLATLELGWNNYESHDGQFAAQYVARMQEKRDAFLRGGMQVVLDPGVQYPPRWIFDLPHSRYLNQFGQAFADPAPGMNGVNTVFNVALREKQARYLQRIFHDFGKDSYAVRLGGGWYDELNYPPHKYQGRQNCYWAFDAIAQGKAGDLPPGITPCPVPAWLPGTPSPGHRSAEQFLNWYLDCLRNYHDWQITTVRHWYSGRLAMLYPSAGIRPGQLRAAVAGDLAGKTSPEINGEIQRGFDFARFVSGVHDPRVVVYSTWLDFPPRFCDDASPDPRRWSPIHHLASLAQQNPLKLQVWGENTGPGDPQAMDLCFERTRRYSLLGFMWAFEKSLYEKQLLDQFRKGIAHANQNESYR